MSLHAYLQQLELPQVAFSVKQKRPKTLIEAVTTTIEMETYLPQGSRNQHRMCRQWAEPERRLSEGTNKVASVE